MLLIAGSAGAAASDAAHAADVPLHIVLIGLAVIAGLGIAAGIGLVAWAQAPPAAGLDILGGLQHAANAVSSFASHL